MLAERLGDDQPPVQLDRSLPALRPVLVAPAHAVEELVRSRRATTAMLALQLRAAEHDHPERDEPGQDDDEVDLNAARALLVAALDDRVARRRQELAEQLERERASAATVVSTAQAEAAALVATASDERLQVLLDGIQPTSGSTPSLRVVSDADALAVAAAVPRVSADVELGDAPTAAALTIAAHPAGGLPAAPVELAAVHAAAIAAASQLIRQSESAASPAASQGAPAARTFRGRWLYVDVLLPMVAVVIVLIVLLAWVG